MLFCFLEGRPRCCFHDYKLCPRKCNRLYKTVYEPRNWDLIQGKERNQISIKLIIFIQVIVFTGTSTYLNGNAVHKYVQKCFAKAECIILTIITTNAC